MEFARFQGKKNIAINLKCFFSSIDSKLTMTHNFYQLEKYFREILLNFFHLLFFSNNNKQNSSLLVVYEGKDGESERIEALLNSNYDADISNCSTDLNVSTHHHDDDELISHACSSNDENDGGIGHEDETTNMDQSLYEEADEMRASARDSGNLEDIDREQISNKFLEPGLRAPSPHSMDSWINYSNSSDEYSPQELIVRKGTKLNLHDDDETQDNDDVDVYDKINFVNAKSMTSSFKKSKIDTAKEEVPQKSNFSHVKSSSPASSVSAQHEIDDGIEVEGEDVDDDQLSSLSSNIDTIIVSESGETKYFNASGEEHVEHPSVKKKKSCDDTSTATVTCTSSSTPNGHSSKLPSPLVDVRIIDFAHTTFTMKEPSPFEDAETKKVPHHGPDGGFLTGVASLKRILSEIMMEAI